MFLPPAPPGGPCTPGPGPCGPPPLLPVFPPGKPPNPPYPIPGGCCSGWTMPPLRPFCLNTQQIVPLVFDDTLSYLEEVRAVYNHLNKVVQYVDNLPGALIHHIHDDIQCAVFRLTECFKKDQMEQCEYWSDRYTELFQKLAYIQTVMYLLHQQAIDYTDNEIAKLLAQIPKLTTVNVISPYDGKMVTIQECVDQLYHNLRYGGLTAAQYDGLHLTAERYDNFRIPPPGYSTGLTAHQYDLYALFILWPRLSPHMMFSDYTGQFVPVQQFIMELSQSIRRDGYSAEYADAMDFTAEEWDDQNLSAYFFAWGRQPDITSL